MYIDSYKREKVIEYAHKWAFLRNPLYYNYDKIGGDCTNFASQCIFAGSKKMNYIKTLGWYYNNSNDKSPAWSGAQYLYKFIVNNKGIGPFGREEKIEKLEIGDIIQLSFDNIKFSHSLVVVENRKEILVATHTYDADYKNIKEYNYENIRGIHIEGVRK